MIGTTAQIAALTCHLNARMRGLDVPRFEANSTCRFCEFVHFIAPRRLLGPWRRQVLSADDWLESVARSCAGGATLVHIPVSEPHFSERMLAGLMGGGGIWSLCMPRRRSHEGWQGVWGVGNRDAGDQRIWRVQYHPCRIVPGRVRSASDIPRLTAQLNENLIEIEEFARSQDLDFWAGQFAAGRRCLTSDEPFRDVYHPDMAPPGALEPAAAQLLASCQKSWVFGAMGSWNDLSFEGDAQATYLRLSDGLYNLLNSSIAAAVNSSAPAT